MEFKDKLYGNDIHKLIKGFPNFACVTFVSWDEIFESLTSDEDLDYLKSNDFLQTLVNKAFELAKDHADEDRIKLENQILQSLQHHWSIKNICASLLDIKSLQREINIWSEIGPNDPKLFGAKPKTGFGVEYWANDGGISFTIYEPFFIPYLELYYLENDSLPEWDFEDLDGYDVIQAFIWKQCQKEIPIFEMNAWEERWDKQWNLELSN